MMKANLAVLCLFNALVATGQNLGSRVEPYILELCAAPEKVDITTDLVCGSPEVRLGSPVMVIVRFTNNSRRVVNDTAGWSELTRYDPNWEFDVRDAEDRPVPRRHYQHEELAGGSFYFRSIPLGKSLKDSVDLGRIYNFERPGNYTVKVSRLVPLDPPQRGKGTWVRSKSIVLVLSE